MTSYARRAGSIEATWSPRRLTGLRHGQWGPPALLLLALPALWPLVARGLPQGLDVPNHLMRLVAFDQQIRAGNFYPRWMPNLVFGYGYPLFNYYAPGAYYLAELFRLAGLAYAPALSAAMAAMLVAGGLGMWRLAGDFFAPTTGALGEGARAGSGWPALVAATAYMYAPYLLINVYVRGAIAELGAQAALPWVLWSVRRLLLSERPAKGYVVPTTLSLAALAVLHNLSLVMVAPLLVAYSGLLWWRHGRRPDRLGWLAAGALGAVGLSAFYWWPLLGERGDLANHVAEVARLWLPLNVWTWAGFLDKGFAYTYNMQSPFGLGLVQVVLAIIGLWEARRLWNAEWLFWALVAVLASLAIGRPALPVWLANEWLLTFQFPWRLLVLVSIPLALFAGGIAAAARRGLWRGTVALLVLGLIIVAQRPRLDLVPRLPPDQQALGPAAEAQFESLTGSLGATTNFLGTTSDFMPRWVDLGYGLDSPPAAGENIDSAGVEVSVQSAGPTGLELGISSARPASLRFGRFYFPDWQLTLDGHQVLAPYPSTHMGLLTVDVPAGQHRLRLAWQGTTLQRVASAVSLVTLALLAFLAWRVMRARWLALAFLAGLLGVGAATLVHSQLSLLPAQAATPASPAFETQGLQLAGYRYEIRAGRWLDLQPYWYVRDTPPDLEFDWRLIGAAGQAVAEIRTRPFYDTLPTTSWRTGSLMADAYSLALPPGLASGAYALELCVSPFGTGAGGCTPRPVGVVDLPAPTAPADAQPAATALGARFGDDLLLTGYAVNGRAPAPTGSPSGNANPVVGPGSELDYTLYWQPLRPMAADYHGFVQLADAHFGVLAQEDKLLGPYFFPSRLWNGPGWQPDSYQLTIPALAASGLYWPTAGVYSAETLQRLSVRDAQGTAVGNDLRLRPIKVLNPPQLPAARQPAQGRFENLASLAGYDLVLPSGGVRVGGSFSVTVYYISSGPAAIDYTRFLHLYAPALGMAAQADAQPQNGLNPTSAWVAGEVVADSASLTLSPTTAPGRYALQVGFYDPASGARVAATDGAGQALADDQAVLTEIDVLP